MIDTHIYDYDIYSRDTEMATYLCVGLVMSDIDAYLRDRSNLSFDDRDYDFDREAAMAMRELCDFKSKESETTVSRKMLHVPEVVEDDKDLEY
jgi:hypothetical protein